MQKLRANKRFLCLCKKHIKGTICLLACVGVLLSSGFSSIYAQAKPDEVLQALGTPANPQVSIHWNRYHDTKAITRILQDIAKAYPQFAKLSSIGKSHEGRDIWCLTLTDFAVGKAEEKPAYYVDGNIHSNEIQTSEVILYLAWYLTEMRAQSAYIQQLLAEKTFYLLPCVNPDGRENFMKAPNTTHSPRSGTVPVDDDRDGLVDEDNFDDLDGDGHITQMRRRSATGKYYPDPTNPLRMLRAPKDQFGGWELLGYEGIDNDGDGAVNEDRVGYSDPNRDWPWYWQPRLVQWGAHKYPFSLPETRLVADFIMGHPNIAGAVCYHNTGGMLLRGPSNAEDKAAYPSTDLSVYNAIGSLGESLLPGYRYINTFEDLYQVYGGQSDWMWGGRGIYSFTGELYNPFVWFGEDNSGSSYYPSEEQQHRFNKYLLLNDAFVAWKPYTHPQYGEIEIGGFKKQFIRINPGFQLEEDCHRNTAFMLYHAWHTPHLHVDNVRTAKLSGGQTQITLDVVNGRIQPTRAQHDITNGISKPDVATLEGNGKVLSGVQLTNVDLGTFSSPNPHEPERLLVDAVPGMDKVTLRWVVSGKGPWAFTYQSEKGGVLRYAIP